MTTPFEHIHHVCIAVEDIDQAISLYESVGIGPWHDYPPLGEFTDLDVPDRDGFLGLVYKWAMAGELQLQLVQPGAGRPPQRAFLDDHGPGVYHIGFVTDRIDEAEREAEALGLRARMRGRRPNGSGFTYFDTRDEAGVILEIRQSPPGEDLTEFIRHANGSPFHQAHHLCIAVGDIKRAIAFYESVGIGPWQPLPPMNDLVELEGPAPEAFHGLTYAWTTVGNLQLQLVQPGSGRTPQGDFHTEHGDSVFHLGFAVDSVDEGEAQAAKLGLEVILRGRRADGSGFSYFDSYENAGVTLQVRQAPGVRG